MREEGGRAKPYRVGRLGALVRGLAGRLVGLRQPLGPHIDVVVMGELACACTAVRISRRASGASSKRQSGRARYTPLAMCCRIRSMLFSSVISPRRSACVSKASKRASSAFGGIPSVPEARRLKPEAFAPVPASYKASAGSRHQFQRSSCPCIARARGAAGQPRPHRAAAGVARLSARRQTICP